MFGTYIGNNRMLVKVVYNGMLTISSEDLSLMPSLVTTGFIEMPLTKFFINQVKPGDTIVDIGSNVGYFTVLAGLLVGSRGTVFSYEANPNIFPFLQDNISMNWLTQQAKIQNKAIYSKETTLEFNVSNKFHGDSSIKTYSSGQQQSDSITKVFSEAVSLDNELRNVDKIDLLKIDIEGGEYHAFLGMMEKIEQKKIKCIVFEWNRTMLGGDAELFAGLIREILYRNDGLIYTLNQEGETVPVSLDIITSVDFYPFAVIEFI
ncbi:FkbM family methyltransferase [Bacillus infantis]|uniref:FkbM family methyltransferase n=1 Tax=Bacillus infantis TaxID=324767 RepID=UPI002004ABCC|nr:FkbM family methyltransferase [Bacillus infantis]MCK6206014.1 FkbM family methyltransferase [Bacillus infantis]